MAGAGGARRPPAEEAPPALVAALLAPPPAAGEERTMRFNFATLEAEPDAVSRTNDYESTPEALLGSFAFRVREANNELVPVKQSSSGGGGDVDVPSWIQQPIFGTGFWTREEELYADFQYSTRVASISACVTDDGTLELRVLGMLTTRPCSAPFDFGRPLPNAMRRPGQTVVKAEPGTAAAGDGKLTRLPTVLRSDPGAAEKICKNRGGEVVVRGADDEGHTFVLRLYTVIAAHDPGSDSPKNVPIAVPGMRAASREARERWQETSPVAAFRAFLSGTVDDPKTTHVPKLRGAESALQTIARRCAALPDWDELTRRVDLARSRCFGKPLLIPLGAHSFPSTEVLVDEYKRFLKIKHLKGDYASEQLSPPMEADGITGVKLLDEIWHLHISMASYDADCRALTGGHVLQHVPALANEAAVRYQRTFVALEASDKQWVKVYKAEERLLTGTPMLEAAREVMRIWPEIESNFESDSGGCC